ncbi:hypothetical protein Dimus_029662 [Dionaea muscipula]
MENQIHHLEKEAYFSVLRAFKAQADAITWDKEGLITELRKELRVSDDEHRELLGRVNNDDMICRIREWRQAGGQKGPVLSTSQTVHDMVSSPSFPAARKKQRTTQSVVSHGVHPSDVHPHSVVAPKQQLASRGSFQSHRRKSKLYPPAISNGNNQTHGTSSLLLAQGTDGHGKELIGRHVFTRWPDDNNFYEAVIFNYDANQDLHALVYDADTPGETWEWVDLKEMDPDDIRWVGEDPGISRRGSHADTKSASHGAGCVGASNELNNGIQRGASDEIEILHTGTLIKEVQKVVATSRPDLVDIRRAKEMLKEHEQSLIEAISMLTYISDGESDGEMQT